MKKTTATKTCATANPRTSCACHCHEVVWCALTCRSAHPPGQRRGADVVLTQLPLHASLVWCGDVQVTVEVLGGKAVKLVIRGEAVLPAVDILEARLDFGEVYTGVTARIPITIVNTTPVLAGAPPPPTPLAARLLLLLLLLPPCAAFPVICLWPVSRHIPFFWCKAVAANFCCCCCC